MSSTISHPLPTPLAATPATSEASDAQALSALLRGVAVAPLSDRGWIRITGEDRVRWLNGMVTNSIADLAPGTGCYNFLLNAQGQIQGDGYVFRPGIAPDSANASGQTGVPELAADTQAALLLQTAAAEVEPLLSLLDRFVIMDDVELSDSSADHHGLLLAGPSAPQLLADLLRLPSTPSEASSSERDASLPAQTPAQTSIQTSTQPTAPITLHETTWRGETLHLVRAFSPLVPRIELWGTPAAIAELQAELRSRAVTPATPLSLIWLRTLEGTPLFGADIRGRELPQETAQTRALHFSKGCYLGQEIVERIRSRGKVNRIFSGFLLHGGLPTLPIPGQTSADIDLLLDGKPVGTLTTVAELPPAALDSANSAEVPTRLALGYIRREVLDRLDQPGQPHRLTYGGGGATPSSLPFFLSSPASTPPAH